MLLRPTFFLCCRSTSPTVSLNVFKATSRSASGWCWSGVRHAQDERVARANRHDEASCLARPSGPLACNAGASYALAKLAVSVHKAVPGAHLEVDGPHSRHGVNPRSVYLVGHFGCQRGTRRRVARHCSAYHESDGKIPVFEIAVHYGKARLDS